MSDLTAGRELDRMIAEKVMGWEHRGAHPLFGTPVYATGKAGTALPRFSDWIEDAWQVVEKMREKGYVWEICPCISESSPPYGASFVPRSDTSRDWEVNRGMIERACVLAETAPLAICLAALRAVGQTKEQSA